MLSHPDADLVSRDRSIPALEILLDPPALAEQLGRLQLGRAITDPSIFYLRYKSGTSCLAGYRVLIDGKEALLNITARRLDAFDKLAKHLERPDLVEPMGTGRAVIAELAMAIAVLPNDSRLPALKRISAPDREQRLLGKLGLTSEMRLERLRYRPQRRLVCKAYSTSGPEAVVKFFRASDYERAAANGNSFASQNCLRVPSIIGCSSRSSAIASSWITGEPALPTPGAARRVGEALAHLHTQTPTGLATMRRADQGRVACSLGTSIAALWPSLGEKAKAIAQGLSRALDAVDTPLVAIHGDFHLDQLIDAGDVIGIVDLDEACYGPAAWDLGNIIGHMRVKGDSSEAFGEQLLAGYRAAGGQVADSEFRLQTALSIFQLAARPFRERNPAWPEKIEAILEQASQCAKLPTSLTGLARPPLDPQMPKMEAALDPKHVQRHFSQLPFGRATSARLIRHKPGRRCLIEYDLSDGSKLVGKMRARGADARCYAIQRELWNNGFGPDAIDGIMVPTPIAIIADLDLWLQRKVAGAPLSIPPEYAAAAIAKLHRSGVKPAKRHGLNDEIQILSARLSALADRQPQWRERLQRLKGEALELAIQTAPARLRSIHRDFYHDHLISDGSLVHIIDLDLFCLGDPAIDIGNYNAHLIELGLRTHGDPDHYRDWQQRFQNHYAKQIGDVSLGNIRIYETLSLIRLIEISDRIEPRRPFTTALLGLCERRLEKHFSAGRKA